jgi:hypothetical protein
VIGARAAALAVAVVLLCGCGSTGKSHRATGVVVAKQTATGKHASATASTEAGRYGAFLARVLASPNQRVAGSWVIGCRGFNSLSHDAGDVKGKTPRTVPMQTTHAEANQMAPGSGKARCTVVAVATLARAGRITVEVLASK